MTALRDPRAEDCGERAQLVAAAALAYADLVEARRAAGDRLAIVRPAELAALTTNAVLVRSTWSAVVAAGEAELLRRFRRARGWAD